MKAKPESAFVTFQTLDGQEEAIKRFGKYPYTVSSGPYDGLI